MTLPTDESSATITPATGMQEEILSFMAQRAMYLLELPALADTLDEATFMQRGLEMAEDLTGSLISFIHFVNEDKETLELVTWSRRTLETYCHAVFDRHYPVSQAGIWAEALRQHRPVMFNDYATAPNKHGLPEGHAHLRRLISLPVIEHDKVVMLAGIGNKATDFTQRDIETLQLLANDIWRFVQRGRSQQQLARFSRLIDRSLNEIFSFDAETLKFVDVNQGACKNLGYSIAELRQMTPIDIKPDMSAEDFARAIEPLKRGETRIVAFTTTHRRKNGSTYPAEVHIEINKDANPLFIATVRDITERHRAEQALREALQVVEASPVVLFRWLATEQWPVEFVSQNIVRWGYAPKDIRAGQPGFIDLVHHDDLPRVAQTVANHAANGPDEYTQTYRLRAGDGHYFWVEDSTHIIRDAAGKPLRYEGVVTDIDIRKRYELELAASLAHQKELNTKLEEAQSQLLQSEKMASIGQLAAGVAHELNNPIGFVGSNLGTLDNYLHDIFAIIDAYTAVDGVALPGCPQLDHARALKQEKDFNFLRTDIVQLLAESRDGLGRVAKIVKDLRDFARAGDAAMQWADLRQGIDSTLNIVWNEIKYKCTIKKEYGDLPEVWCVPSQLNQVFMNLLVNAGQAIADKGEITIRAGRQGQRAFVAIADTGVGIPPENLNRIFDPFFTTKPVGKGTGLGLSLVYGIVRKHHGEITVASTPGAGTTFTVWLPIDPLTLGP